MIFYSFTYKKNGPEIPIDSNLFCITKTIKTNSATTRTESTFVYGK